MLVSSERDRLSLPARTVGDSPIRNRASHDRGRSNGSVRGARSENGENMDDYHDHDFHEPINYIGRHRNNGDDIAWRSGRHDEMSSSAEEHKDLHRRHDPLERGRTATLNGCDSIQDPDVENASRIDRHKGSAWGTAKQSLSVKEGNDSWAGNVSVKVGASAAPAAVGQSNPKETRPRSGSRIGASSGLERGLVGVGESLRSSWSSSVLPPMPNGEAVPALLSHLAELRSMCQRQRESGKSMRRALVRKQGHLDDASAEVSWLRAELGFIVGDMLGALQGNPTARAIFRSLSERIRNDLGAEEAAVYIDLGDGTLLHLPQGGGSGHKRRRQGRRDRGVSNESNDDDDDVGGNEEQEAVFIQRGVGVVGLVALGTVPDSAAGGSVHGGGGADGIDVLLLNDGLEAFDNGSTVEASLLRAARRRRSGVDGFAYGEQEREDVADGIVRNMLLARIGSGMTTEGRVAHDFAATAAGGRVKASPRYSPHPPTAVIQALNKKVAPGHFTQGDARAIRTLAPAITAGSRLIVSLLHCSQSTTNAVESSDGMCVGRCRTGSVPATSDAAGRAGVPRFPDEERLLDSVWRARNALQADRARVYVLDPSNIGFGDSRRLRLWHEDTGTSGSDSTASFRSGSSGTRRWHGATGATGALTIAAGTGLQGVALKSACVSRSADALSDPLYDNELDLKEGFLVRSVLFAPLYNMPSKRDKGYACAAVDVKNSKTDRGSPLGVLEVVIGRGGGGGASDVLRSELDCRQSASNNDRTKSSRKKTFVVEDEQMAESFAAEIGGCLSRLLSSGFRPRSFATTLAGGGEHVGASDVAPKTCSWRRGAEKTVSSGTAQRLQQWHPQEGINVGENSSRAGGDEDTGYARQWEQDSEPAHLPSSPPEGKAAAAEGQRQCLSHEGVSKGSERPGDGGGTPCATEPTSMVRSKLDRDILRYGIASEVEARDNVVVRGPLCSSVASTAVPSPLGVAGLRASTATATGRTDVVDKHNGSPLPPSPATDGTSDGGSPESRLRQEEQEYAAIVRDLHGASRSGKNVIPQGGQHKQPLLPHQQNQDKQFSAAAVEANTQARSWATAHRVLETCKESLAADKRFLWQSHDRSSDRIPATDTNANAERISPALRSLVASLLPGCTAVFLIYDGAADSLREASCRPGSDSGADGRRENRDHDHLPVHHQSRLVRREDVARRALASGKALLAQVEEKAEFVNGSDRRHGLVSAKEDGNAYGFGMGAGGDGAGPSNSSGERVFCIPLCRPTAGPKYGVLQLFLPPPPPLSSPVLPPFPSDFSRYPANATQPSPSAAALAGATAVPVGLVDPHINSGVSNGSLPPVQPPRSLMPSASLLRPPPPSFFMATKIVADSLALVLGWCEALDRAEEGRDADADAMRASFAAATDTAAKVEEERRREFKTRLETDARKADELRAATAADNAHAHARAVASLLERGDSLVAATAEACARAKSRRIAVRALVAWRNASKRSRCGEVHAARMESRRRARAFREWKVRASARRRARKVEDAGVVALNRRGLRCVFGVWIRAAARGRRAEERRLAGARAIAEICRRGNPVKRSFMIWRLAAQGVFAAGQAIARKEADDLIKACAEEERASLEARAQCMADRVADLLQRRRRERLMRSACKGWIGRAQRIGRARVSWRRANKWRRHRGMHLALQRWRSVALTSHASKSAVGPTVLGNAGSKIDSSAMDYPASTIAQNVEDVRSKREDSPTADVSTAVDADERDGFCSSSSAAAAAGAVAAAAEPGTAQAMAMAVLTASPSNNDVSADVAEQQIEQRVQQHDRRLEEYSERLARAAAGTFAQQKEKRLALRVLTAWRRTVRMEHCKRETLSRLWRRRRARALDDGLRRWKAGVLVIRAMTYRQTMAAEAADQTAAVAAAAARKVAAASTAAEASAAARLAAEMLMRAREQELERERQMVAELRNTVEEMRSEASEIKLRHQAADAHLRERAARASLLSLSVGQAFVEGRERLRAARALTAMRDNARAGRLASSAAHRVTTLRLSLCLRSWRGKARVARHRANQISSAAAVAKEGVARSVKSGARAYLRVWAATTERRSGRKRSEVVAHNTARLRKLWAAVRLWRKACRDREARKTADARAAACVERARTRRALRVWRKVSFGDDASSGSGAHGRDTDDIAVAGGHTAGGRALARLVGVAVKVDEARGRRRARAALQEWCTRVQGARRRAKREMRVTQALAEGNVIVALVRWRQTCLVRRRMRRVLDRGEAWAAKRGVTKAWLILRQNAQLATKRKAMLAVETAAKGQPGAFENSKTSRPTFVSSQAKATCDAVVTESRTPYETGEALPGGESARKDSEALSEEESPAKKEPASGSFDAEGVDGGDGDRSGSRTVDEGEETKSQSLLNLLVDVCAAPPPYSLGSGIEALGQEACTAAVRTFDLVSASLFQVVDSSPQAMAVRVAHVVTGCTPYNQDFEGDEAINDVSAAATKAAVLRAAEPGNPERELVGEGTVGVAAQSARPVCVHVYPSPWATIASTALCIPVMLQAASASMTLPAVVSDGNNNNCRGISSAAPSPSVEVIGVLRALRHGTNAFAGDDARAVSAFCGQLALTMVAERILADSRAKVRASSEAVKRARNLRRQACLRVTELFTEGALAGSLLQRHTMVEAPTELSISAAHDEDYTCAVRQQLWESVAGLAADALGCDRVDLLQVASLSGDGGPVEGDGGTGAPSLARLLSQRPHSRRLSRGRRSYNYLAQAPASSSHSTVGVGDNSISGDSGNNDDVVSNWLCVPVLGDAGKGQQGAGGGAIGRSANAGVATVCCAVNKQDGRSFDDADEMVLGTIAALYGVAASWVPPTAASPPHLNCPEDAAIAASNARTSTANFSVQGQTSAANLGDLPPRSATVGDAPTLCPFGKEFVSTRAVGVNTSPSLRKDRIRHADSSSANNHGAQVSFAPAVDHATHSDEHRGEETNDRCSLGKDGSRGVGRDSPAPARKETAAGAMSRHGGSTPVGDKHFTARGRFCPRPAPRLLEEVHSCRFGTHSIEPTPESGMDAHTQPSPHGDSFPTVTSDVVEENLELRRRAERAERVLGATRERLCRALEDGAINAAAAAAAAAATVADQVDGSSSDGDHSVNDVAIGAGLRYEEETVPFAHYETRGHPRHVRGRSAQRFPPPSAALSTTDVFRKTAPRSKSSTGVGRRMMRGRASMPVPPPRKSASSCDLREGCLSDGDVGDRRQRRRRHRRRSHEMLKPPSEQIGTDTSSDVVNVAHELQSYDRDGGGNDSLEEERREECRETRKVRSQRKHQQQPRQKHQLRASDLTRMREVVSRLRIATAQLEAERADRAGRVDAVGDRRDSEVQVNHDGRMPLLPLGVAAGGGVSRAPAAVDALAGVHKRGAVDAERRESVSAAALLKENATLRRRLCGLMALEELEGKAVQRGLLPLTGGGISGGDFFTSDNRSSTA